MKLETIKNYAHLHFIVLIYGFTGILGKLISLPAHSLVFYRLLLALPILLTIIYFRKETLKIGKKKLLQYLGIGVIIGLHWLAFFHSIKVSNVSIALSCFASVTLFTGILEPLIAKKPIQKLEIICGIIVLVALSVVLGFEVRYWLGIAWGILAAFLGALFTVLNKQMSDNGAVTLSFYELFGALLPVSIVWIIMILTNQPNALQVPTFSDWAWLLLLASVCTAYPFVAVIKLLRSLSAYTVNLAINFEPIYAMILAYLIFGDSERMTTTFYIGICVVFGVVFLYPVLKRGLRCEV